MKPNVLDRPVLRVSPRPRVSVAGSRTREHEHEIRAAWQTHFRRCGHQRVQAWPVGLSDTRELFLSFDLFPWFRDAPIGKVMRVELASPEHLYWPDLDIDLAVESIEHPEPFPLVSRVRPNSTLQPGRRAARR